MAIFLGEYISQNWMDILVSIFTGIIVTLIFVPKNSNSPTNNNTDIQESKKRISEIIIIRKPFNDPKTKHSNDNENDSAVIIIVLILAVIATYLFLKYYFIILDIYTSIIIFIFIATLGIAIKLHRNNQYDQLNRFWTMLMLVITVYNLSHLAIISKQDLSNINLNSIDKMIESMGVESLFGFIYQTMGFLIGIIPNILAFTLLIHILAVNQLLFKKSKFSSWVVSHTKIFMRPLYLSITTVLFIILSLLFSSGLAYNFIQNINS